MPAGSPRPLQQPPRAERRTLLARHFVEAVEPLLEAGETYADISVERLIKAVDISRSTFYVYFDDKGDLLGAMAQDVTRDLAEAGSGWFEFPVDATKDDLREAIRPLFETYRRHQLLLGAITEAAAYDPRVREQHLALVGQAVDGLKAQIQLQQRAGGAPAELDAQRTALWLTWMHERGLYQMVPSASAREVHKLLDAMVDLVWRTLYAGFHD
ncbi:TetR/AcrR family transcriptional regulator [Paraconexibacter algicola]|uniref:TetR/AcrR family transcriptional regulator n=1 Tax=Paraconexibacter algicola TaxID=2133960 RepID=A0A2T4ULS1_9ACTN|nr:TetR/AcrR family transcriptional regulator [Paraconexibacter algicola]PTL60155.1 TetR/AcrR family transcriptional regulator [Paraconexibacter algicola]